MVSLTLNGKPYQCSTCKEELTIGQYQRLLKEWGIDEKDLTKRDYLSAFNILSKSDFKSVSLDLESEQAIWESVSWLLGFDFTYPREEMPKVLQINDKTLQLPEKVGACSFGQNVILKQIIDKSKYIEESISMAVAVYLMPDYYGFDTIINGRVVTTKALFSADKARELELIIREMPASLIYPIGFFLLTRANLSGTPSTNPKLLTQNSLKQNLKRMLPRWLKSKDLPGMRT